MALTVASRLYVPKAPVRLHKPPQREPSLLGEGGAERRVMGRECENVAERHLFSCSHKAEHLFYESRGEIPRRTPVVSSFPFFLGKERKLTGEASSTEESERIGIFPDAASSSGLHRLTMLATAFLASEKIPMILSDNGRRGLTLQRKETAARLKFS